MTIRDAVARLRAESACEDAIEWFDAAIAGTPSKFRVEPEWLEWAMRNKCLPETFRPAWAAYLSIEEPARAAYLSIEKPAWAAYLSSEKPAWSDYQAIVTPAWAAYLAIAEPARVVIEAEIRRLCAEESK